MAGKNKIMTSQDTINQEKSTPIKTRLPQAALTLKSISTLILRALIQEFAEAWVDWIIKKGKKKLSLHCFTMWLNLSWANSLQLPKQKGRPFRCQVMGRTGEGVLASSQTGNFWVRESPENVEVPSTALPHGLCKHQDKKHPAGR